MTLTETEAEKTVGEVLREGIGFLEKHGMESARVLGERLLEGLLDCSRHELYLEGGRILPRETVETYFACLERRARGVPCQYILGKAHFMDFVFRVTPCVLIPRPETEFLVEKILEEAGMKSFEKGGPEILDVGTGSGNIAVSLAAYLPQAAISAVDISEEALEIARENARRIGRRGDARNAAATGIEFLKSDLFDRLPRTKRFDMIVSNPPYLSGEEMRNLPPEVSREPALALFGGERGTELIERLAAGAGDFLKPGGILFFEIGYEQGDMTRRLLRELGWREVEVFRDYCGRDRVVRAADFRSTACGTD